MLWTGPLQSSAFAASAEITIGLDRKAVGVQAMQCLPATCRLAGTPLLCCCMPCCGGCNSGVVLLPAWGRGLAAQPLDPDFLPGLLAIQGPVEAALQASQGRQHRARVSSSHRAGGSRAATRHPAAGAVRSRHVWQRRECSINPRGAAPLTRRFMYWRAPRVDLIFTAPTSSCFLPCVVSKPCS